MANRTPIEWTATVNPDGTRTPGASWNPIRARNKVTGKVGWFCTHASDGCRFCYAEGFNHRLGTGVDYRAQDRGRVEIFVDEKILLDPIRWRRPRKVFTLSMSDLFGEFIPDEMIDRVFAVMALAPQHTFLVLTKRAQRMRDYLTARNGMGNASICRAINAIPAGMGNRHGTLEMPLPNVWLGVSAEDQPRADERIPLLLDTPAAKRFVSLEPLLGPIDLKKPIHHAIEQRKGRGETYGPGLDWAIVGAESGPNARPWSIQWARELRDQCVAAGVAFFWKQNGEWIPAGSGPSGEPGRFAFGDYEEDRSMRESAGAGRPRQFTTFGARSVMKRVGKKAAGRLLDGREWNEVPTGTH